MGLFDFTHPFFDPLWRRILVVVVCIGWGSYEFYTLAPFWGCVFVALGLYAGWEFFGAERNKTD